MQTGIVLLFVSLGLKEGGTVPILPHGAHEAASAIEAHPLRYWALADAARCYAQAGETGRAKALADRLELEAPTLNLPPHVRTKLRELRLAN